MTGIGTEHIFSPRVGIDGIYQFYTIDINVNCEALDMIFAVGLNNIPKKSTKKTLQSNLKFKIGDSAITTDASEGYEYDSEYDVFLDRRSRIIANKEHVIKDYKIKLSERTGEVETFINFEDATPFVWVPESTLKIVPKEECTPAAKSKKLVDLLISKGYKFDPCADYLIYLAKGTKLRDADNGDTIICDEDTLAERISSKFDTVNNTLEISLTYNNKPCVINASELSLPIPKTPVDKRNLILKCEDTICVYEDDTEFHRFSLRGWHSFGKSGRFVEGYEMPIEIVDTRFTYIYDRREPCEPTMMVKIRPALKSDYGESSIETWYNGHSTWVSYSILEEPKND